MKWRDDDGNLHCFTGVSRNLGATALLISLPFHIQTWGACTISLLPETLACDCLADVHRGRPSCHRMQRPMRTLPILQVCVRRGVISTDDDWASDG